MNLLQYSFYATYPPVLADAGYRSESCLEELEHRQIDADVSLRREGKNYGTIDTEAYPATARMAAKLVGADGKARYADSAIHPLSSVFSTYFRH